MTTDWVERVRPTILANLSLFCRSGDAAEWRETHVASLAKYLTDIDPSLAPPSFILRSEEQRSASILLTSNTDDAESAPNSQHLISIYKALARRVTRIVRRKMASTHHPNRQFCMATRAAISREPANIALYSWRMFWEGLGRLESNVLFTRTPKDRWRLQVLDRAKRMFGESAYSDAAHWSQWTDSHLFAAACLGTLAECMKRSNEVESTEYAGELASSLTCEFVPFCLTNKVGPRIPLQTLHLVVSEEFSALQAFFA